MAFADGMMQADKLNKEDDTYWRKQAKEDRDMQYQERDQAYKEQEQGYKLNTFEDFQQNKEAGLLSAQAYDAYAQKAKAMGVPIHQVIMDSPAFELPNATPGMQTRFNQKLNEAIQTNVIASLRQNRDFESANRLTGRLGLPGQTAENPMMSFGDPEKEAAFISSKMPYLQRSETGQYQYQDLVIPPEQAMFLAHSTPAAALAAINVMRQQKTLNATTQTQQTQLQASGAEAIARARYTGLAAQARAGTPIGQIYPPDQEAYAKMLSSMPPVAGASASGANPNSIAAMTSAPALPVTPGVSPTGGVTNRTAPAMPAQQSNVPAMPVRQSDVPVRQSDVPSAPTGSSSLLSDFKASNIKLEKAKSAVSEAQRDINLLENAKNKGHFDPETLARARATLEAAAANYQQVNLTHYSTSQAWRAAVAAEENRYNASNMPGGARSARPVYLDALANKYR